MDKFFHCENKKENGQAEAEVVPSSSLVEVGVEVEVEVGVRFRSDQFKYSLDSGKIISRMNLDAT